MRLGQALLVAQCIALAYWFGYSFFYPGETGAWLVHSGFLLLVLEFFSVFPMLAIPHWLGKKTGWTYSGNMHPLVAVALVFVLALGFTVLMGGESALGLFAYFVVSVAVKAFAVAQKKDAMDEGKAAAAVVVSIALSAFAATLLSPLALAFPENLAVLQGAFGLGDSGLAVDNPGLIALWGILYFALLAVFEAFGFLEFRSATRVTGSSP